MTYYYARPHPLWKTQPEAILDGKLTPIIGADGKTVVRKYTLAIGDGSDYEVKLTNGPAIPWKKFKRKRDAEKFINEFNLSASG